VTASHAAPPPPPDQASRDRIVLDLDTCLLVEAAAGTGKTTCMIARMIAVLRSGRARIDQIAAVTFTRKAAAEIRSRFQLDLEGALSSAEGQSRTRLAAALAHIDHCFIGTIHAFCARLLRERPVEAGVDISFAELDENEDYRLREQAWREHVATMIAEDDAVLPELETLGLKVIARTRNVASLLAELEEMGLEAAQLGQTFLTLTDYPDVDDWPAPPRELPDPAPATAALREFMDYARKRKLADDPGRDKLMPKLEQLQRLMRYRDLKQPPQLMEVLELFSSMKRTSIVQKNWPEGKDVAVQTLDKWNHFTATHAEPLLDAWRQRRYHFVMRAMRPAGDIYDRLRQQRNALNFQDLLLKSAELLRSHPSVRRYFQQRFTHLLVDEFQDTDPLQAEVMFLLTADDVNERQWQRCRPRPGALFVVGDPKQSIYRFRRADIVIYNRVRERIEETGGAVVPLTANFRSLPAVIDWINGCFDTMFPAAATDVQP
jgi:ATP-dependent helicase/nuclease subunit A